MEPDTGSNICRICLKKQDTLFSIFHKRNGASPFEKLLNKTPLKIELNDPGPSSICSQCLIDLDTTVAFLEKCEQSNQALAARLEDVEDEESVEKCSNLKNLFPDVNVRKLEPVLEVPVPTITDVEPSHSESKALKPSEVIMGAHICPVCGSKRRCAHWTPPTSFTCQYCNKIFNKRYNFQIHLKRHLGERDWPCSKCGTYHVTEWLALHHCQPKARKVCPTPNCGKTFSNNASLQIHIRSHSGERPFECQVCDKQFTSRKTLKDHVRIHTGEKPYVCHICGARFTSNHLSAHARTHTHARRHACGRAGCTRGFASAAALRDHARAHASARTFACALCASAYKYKQSLNHHVRKRHGVKSSSQ